VLLEDAKQLHLQVHGDVPHLVEEERAVVRRLEAAYPIAHSAGERAADVAEELALEQLAGERGGVHGDERAGLARRVGVDHPRGHLLAGAALARDEHGRLAVLERVDETEHPRHRARAGDEAEAADGPARLDGRLVRGAQHDEVLGLGIAHAVAIALERRRRHGHEVRLGALGLEDGAPALALLAGEQRLPQRSIRAEHLGAEERLHRAAAEPRRGAGAEERVEHV
jgi:hypothetical protein